MQKQKYRSTPLRSLPVATFMTLLLLMSRSAAAQCNPSYDPNCGETPGVGPNVGMSPAGGTYTAETPGGLTVPITIAFTDPDGLNAGTLQVRLWNAGSYVAVPLTASTRGDGSRVTATGIIELTAAGENVLVAQMANKLGVVGSGRASFNLTFADPGVPIVSADMHHNEFRDTARQTVVIPYTVWSHTSMGADRAISLVYNAEQAKPSAFIQLDARPGPGSSSTVTALSLHLEQWTAGSTTGARVGRESFYAPNPTGLDQRLAVRLNLMNHATGAYKYWAVVRSHFSNQPPKEKRILVRVLIINERNSRYGVGWSLGGIQRLYETTDGILLNEGDGTARFFERRCSGSSCSYVAPAGDFSSIAHFPGSGEWVRTYTDGSFTTFSSRGLMIRYTDRFGNATSFEWQDTQYAPQVPVLVRVVDPAGHAFTFTYGSNGYLSRVTTAGSSTVAVSYNAVMDVTDISGSPGVQFAYGDDHDLLAATTYYSSTATVEAIAGGITWKYAYDEYRRLKTLVAPQIAVNGLLSRPQSHFRSLEKTVLLAKDAGTDLGHLAPALASDGVFSLVTDRHGHSTQIATDRYGSPTKVIDAAGDTVTMKWTADGLPAHSNSKTEWLSYVWSSTGQLLLQSVNGRPVYEASYDSYGLPEFEAVGGAVTWYEYGPRRELVRSWYGKQTDASRNGTTYEYNAQYQLVRTVGPKGLKIEWAYTGNTWRNPDHQQTWHEDGTYTTVAFTYDSRSRVRTVKNTYNHTTTTEYDTYNRPVSVLDPRGRYTYFEYTGPHLTKVTDTAGKAYQFSFNALGWLETERFPDGAATRTYAYDAEGLLLRATDRRGRTVTWTYDEAHRQRTRVADGLTTSFSYPDAFTNVVSNGESEVVIKTVADVGAQDYMTSTLGGKAFEIKRVYDIEDAYRPKGFDLNTWNNGALLRQDKFRTGVSYAPIEPGQSSSYSIVGYSGLTTTKAFDEAGRPIRTYFPSGVTQQKAFTEDGRLASMTFNATTPNQKLGATYSYDFESRLNTRTNIAGDLYWSYAYDQLGQVERYGAYRDLPEWCTPATCPPPGPIRQEVYAYDAAGNRTDRGGTVAPGTNRLTQFGGYSFTYDAEGNVTGKNSASDNHSLTWNDLGQLASVTRNGVTVTYGYDGMGRRVRRTENGVSRYFLYDGDDLLMEADQNGAPIRTYTHWPGVDAPHSVRVTNSSGQNFIYYYITEAPGHVTGLLNEAGQVVAEYRYTPWGEVESTTDTTGQPLQYMAREIDATTGMYYVRARWYDPAMARFVSQDPIGLAGGMNTYAYVTNDPVNRRDPSGLWAGAGIDPIVLEDVVVVGRPKSGCHWAAQTFLYFGHCLSEDAFNHDEPLMRSLGLLPPEPQELCVTTRAGRRTCYAQGRWDGRELSLMLMPTPMGGAAGSAVSRGVTFIGRMRVVRQFRGAQGATVANIRGWAKMTYQQRVAALTEFIQAAHARGDALVQLGEGGFWTQMEREIANKIGMPVIRW